MGAENSTQNRMEREEAAQQEAEALRQQILRMKSEEAAWQQEAAALRQQILRMKSEEAAWRQEAEALRQQILRHLELMRALSLSNYALPHPLSPYSSEEEDLPDFRMKSEEAARQQEAAALQLQMFRMKSEEAAWRQEAAALLLQILSTPEERTASDSLINQILEGKKALLEEKKTFQEEKRAFQEEKRAFREEKITKALDSLICLKYGKSLHLSSKEEDLSDLSDTDLYDGLTEDQKKSEEERRSVSPSGSCDAQSDRSKGDNPNFSSSADSGMEDDD
ncbi:golgin subfamily A member 6-like protein 6 [Centroberyx affinis]|uniref:golgin subfamily A member 6-like protein 6 n=1 Tax=Centroberyx affinis TaxID=166261 RepID=UPI003A5B963B